MRSHNKFEPDWLSRLLETNGQAKYIHIFITAVGGGAGSSLLPEGRGVQSYRTPSNKEENLRRRLRRT